MTDNNYNNEYREWCLVKAKQNIFVIREYITQHPNGYFFDDAMELFISLKEIERERMLTKPSIYSRERLNRMRKEGIFSDNELIQDGIQTDYSLWMLDNYDQVCENLPNIQMEIAKCHSECSPNCTDLYIWGAPTSGKSSLVTGLISSSRVMLNSRGVCVPYAFALLQYRDFGCTIGHTMCDFVPTIEVSVSGDRGNCENRFNIVETFSENFALKITQNSNREVSLFDMGHGINSLLGNGNRKVFFFVIDPTKTSVQINHVVFGGQPVCTKVNQCLILQEIITLMERPENAGIMRKVNSLHIIVTKADELAKSYEMRDQQAKELLKNNYGKLIESIHHLCRQYHINFSTNYMPRLYTFSLGDFYASGLYKYDNRDSDKLVNVLLHNTSGCAGRTFQERLRNVLNNEDKTLSAYSKILLGIMTIPYSIVSSSAQSVIKSLKKMKRYPKQYGTSFSPTGILSDYTNVYSSIFAPAEVKRKSKMMVQIYLHLYEETEDVKALAQESDKKAERRDYIPLQCKLKKGDKVDVQLNIYGETLLISEKKSVIWQGHFTKCSFDYLVPKDIDVDELSCLALLTVNEIPVGEMRFITKIVEQPRKLNPEIIAHNYNKVFISYSHQDESKVKFLHKGLAMGNVPHFFDRSYLKPGDIFPKVIQDYINTADLFVLCWSENAAQSEYVKKERIQALERAYPKVHDGKLSIYPMSIEPRAELPSDMKDYYHFGEI